MFRGHTLSLGGDWWTGSTDVMCDVVFDGCVMIFMNLSDFGELRVWMSRYAFEKK